MVAKEIMVMESEFAGHLLSLPVRDIYGRNMGEIVGVVYNLEGKIEMIGVSESAGKFSTYPGTRLVKGNSEILVVPEWREEAQNLARQKESLSRRQSAIEELARCNDLDPRIFDEVSAQIREARASHERLREKVEARLKELESRHQSVSDFTSTAKVQHVTAEIDEWAYSITSEFARIELEMDGKEISELRSAMGFLEKIEERDEVPSAGPLPQPQTNFAPVLFDIVPEANAAKVAITAIPSL